MARFMEFEGNLTEDPKLTTFDDGNAAVRFRLIDNPQHTDQRSGEIVKDEPVAISCSARGNLARHIARCSKGERLVVSGQWRTRAYTTAEGEGRTTDYLAVDTAGLSLRFDSRGADAS